MKELIIKDYRIVLKSILELSNKNEQKYVLKKYLTTQIGSYETIHGYREKSFLLGSIWTIGSKNAIDEIDDEIKEIPVGEVEPEGYKFLFTRVIGEGNSLALLTDYTYYWNVFPNGYDLKKTKIDKYKINTQFSDLCCYTYADELGKAVEELPDYLTDKVNNRKLIKKIKNN